MPETLQCGKQFWIVVAWNWHVSVNISNLVDLMPKIFSTRIGTFSFINPGSKLSLLNRVFCTCSLPNYSVYCQLKIGWTSVIAACSQFSLRKKKWYGILVYWAFFLMKKRHLWEKNSNSIHHLVGMNDTGAFNILAEFLWWFQYSFRF